MPIIETDTLLLRPFTLDDAEGLNDVNRDPQVMQFIGPVEDSVVKTRDYLRQGPLADYKKFGFGRHACIDKNTNKVIGFCGLKYVQELQDVDIGYRFLPQYWGKGLATSTGELMMNFAKNELQLKRVIGLALAGNAGSIKVLLKLGLSHQGSVQYLGSECQYYVWQG